MENNTEKPIEKLDNDLKVTSKKQNKSKQKITETPEKHEIPKTKIDVKKESKEKIETKKPEIQNKKIAKKNKAVVNIRNAPVSTKFSMAICKFIKHKEIEKAINELEQVIAYKKTISMRGGVGHKKSAGGFASGSGKYPQEASKYFITLLKSLSANAITNRQENPIITEAFSNMGQKPRARFGRWQRKRTHIRLVARNKINESTKNKKLEKKNEK